MQSAIQTPSSRPRLSRDLMKISEHQLGTKFRSKSDLYSYMTEILHLYLPPKSAINKDFIKQILKDEKRVLRLDEVKWIKVPRYEEFSVKAMMADALEDEEISKYLPEQSSKNKPIDRQFFFNILNTIHPDFIKELIDHSQNSRNNPEMDEEKKEFILISDDWYEKLMSHPFVSKKPGKTIQLLKESAKMSKGRKPRERKQLVTTLKRFKGINNQQMRRSETERLDDSRGLNDLYDRFDITETSTPQRKQTFNI